MKTPHDDWPWWMTLLLSPLAVAYAAAVCGASLTVWCAGNKRCLASWGLLFAFQLALIVWVLFGKSPAWESTPFPVFTPIENYGTNWIGVAAAAALIAVHLVVLAWPTHVK